MKLSTITAFAGALLTATLVQGFQPADAEAYVFIKRGSCSSVRWSSDPLFRISNTSFPGAFSKAAVYDTANTIENTGGKWLEFGWSTFNGGGSFGNNTNDIWMASFAQWGLENFAGWAVVDANTNSCRFRNVDVVFDGDDKFFRGVPGDYGYNYWDADYTLVINGVNRKSLRMIAVHEMLHAAGLAHEDNTWAMMNYGDYPWASHADQHRMSPLPDDRRGLRALYPSSGVERDVAVVNNYVNMDDVSSNGVPRQRRLCRPRGGSGFSNSMFDTNCATSPTLFVCPGDKIYTRYSLANYSTVATTVTERLYFSSDEQLNFWDVDSSTSHSRILNAGRHHRQGHSFKVPSDLLAGSVYNLILKIDSTLPNEYEGNNWIPLRGKIVASFSCNPAFWN